MGESLPALLLTALGALVGNAVLGLVLSWHRLLRDEHRSPAPGPWRRAALWFDRRLNRARRSRRDRIVRGALVAVLMVAGGAAAGTGMELLLADRPWRFWIFGAVLALSLDQQAAFRRILAVATALRLLGGSLVRAREAAAVFLGPAVGRLDQHGIARAAIAEAALRFARGTVAPLFWFLFLGLPGLLAAVAADVLHGVSGNRQSFGRAARVAEAAIAFLPARIAGVLLAFASAGVPGAQPEAAFPAMMRRRRDQRRRRAESINAGWPLGAVAGALDVSLDIAPAGDGAGNASRIPSEGRARATSGDVDRMLLIYAIACGLLAVALLVAWTMARFLLE
jgi:adenosylcobinamide-phosphate synthase